LQSANLFYSLGSVAATSCVIEWMGREGSKFIREGLRGYTRLSKG
jgi:hypothetical protein